VSDMPSVKQHFGKIITYTEEILVAAKSGDWSLVDTMQVTQKQMLQQFFETPVADQYRPLISSGLRVIKKRNDKIMVICQQARNRLMEDMRGMSKGKSLGKAYQSY
jgi:hypothetical protein